MLCVDVKSTFVAILCFVFRTSPTRRSLLVLRLSNHSHYFITRCVYARCVVCGGCFFFPEFVRDSSTKQYADLVTGDIERYLAAALSRLVVWS